MPIEIVTKHLARRVFNKDPHSKITNIDIKAGATSADLEKAKEEFAAGASDYFLLSGDFRTTAADITKYVSDFMALNPGTKPIVIIDYLQLIAPPQGFKGGIREITDENLKTLKDLQKKNGLFVIVVSSFNRSSNLEPVSYESFKESSMIEFTCDYVWGLQLAIQDTDNTAFYVKEGINGGQTQRPDNEKRAAMNTEQQKTPKQVEFVSLKNRNGRQFFKAFFDYYPQYWYSIK